MLKIELPTRDQEFGERTSAANSPTWMSGIGRWHHQLWREDQPYGHAVSLDPSVDRTCRVTTLAESPSFARLVHRAMLLLEDLEEDPMFGLSGAVRLGHCDHDDLDALLVVPEESTRGARILPFRAHTKSIVNDESPFGGIRPMTIAGFAGWRRQIEVIRVFP